MGTTTGTPNNATATPDTDGNVVVPKAARLLRQEQMPVVDRVEGPAH